MRYVIVDSEGASRAYFDSRAEARMALQELDDEVARTTAELYVVGYDEGGARALGPQAADEFLEFSRA